MNKEFIIKYEDRILKVAQYIQKKKKVTLITTYENFVYTIKYDLFKEIINTLAQAQLIKIVNKVFIWTGPKLDATT